MKTEITYYLNRRNPHKYLEIHDDGYSHWSVRQFMFWRATKVKNYTGDRKLHRWRKQNLNSLLEDYDICLFY